MATSSGTATDQNDLMDDLITFLTAQSWTVNKDDELTPEVVNERRVYFESPTIASIGNVFINIRQYFDAGSGYYNWEIRYATEFDGGLTFDNQPGVSPLEGSNRGTPTLTLFNSSMDYWFVANDRRFIVLAVVDTVRVGMYAGLYLAYAPPAEFGYPVYIGANGGQEGDIYSLGTYELGSFWDPGYSAGNYVHGLLRHYDGTHIPIYNYTVGGGGSRSDENDTGIWPYFELNQLDSDEKIVGHPDGSYTVLPLVLNSEQNDGNAYGELEGAYFVSEEGLLTEDDLTISTITYLIFQPVYRSNILGYAAVRLS